MSTILVVGASGTVGSELSRLLKSDGHTVLKSTSKTTIEKDQIKLNLLTKEGLEYAMQGVDKVFLLCPPGHVNQHELLIPVIERAKKSGIQKIILMTAMGANAIDTTPLRKAELYLINSGLPYNIIRPNWFMQNFNTFWIEGINRFGKILLPVSDARGSFIDARDIAAVAAQLLSTDDFINQEFDLTGDDVLNHHEVAEILGQITNKTIVFEDISSEKMLQTLMAAGMNLDYAEFLNTILGYFKEGYSERTTDSVKKITGISPRKFVDYAKDYKSFWS